MTSSCPNDTTLLELVGSRVQTARDKLGISQQQLAARTAITRTQLSRLESGAADNPRFLSYAHLAATLGVSLDALVAIPPTRFEQELAAQVASGAWSLEGRLESIERNLIAIVEPGAALNKLIERSEMWTDGFVVVDPADPSSPAWSPLPVATTWEGACAMADVFVAMGFAAGGGNDGNMRFFMEMTRSVLRCLLHAAAFDRGTMHDVAEWASRLDDDIQAAEVTDTLRRFGDPQAVELWAQITAREHRLRANIAASAASAIGLYTAATTHWGDGAVVRLDVGRVFGDATTAALVLVLDPALPSLSVLYAGILRSLHIALEADAIDEPVTIAYVGTSLVDELVRVGLPERAALTERGALECISGHASANRSALVTTDGAALRSDRTLRLLASDMRTRWATEQRDPTAPIGGPDRDVLWSEWGAIRESIAKGLQQAAMIGNTDLLGELYLDPATLTRAAELIRRHRLLTDAPLVLEPWVIERRVETMPGVSMEPRDWDRAVEILQRAAPGLAARSPLGQTTPWDAELPRLHDAQQLARALAGCTHAERFGPDFGSFDYMLEGRLAQKPTQRVLEQLRATVDPSNPAAVLFEGELSAEDFAHLWQLARHIAWAWRNATAITSTWFYLNEDDAIAVREGFPSPLGVLFGGTNGRLHADIIPSVGVRIIVPSDDTASDGAE